MNKTISERLAANAADKKPLDSNRQNRAIFLALRKEIIQALDNGWPISIKTLHEEGKVTFGYDSFRRPSLVKNNRTR